MPTAASEHPTPYTVLNPTGRANIVITCDHASRATPADLGTLGIGEAEICRHIGWDIGAADIARWLSSSLDAPAVLAGVSRLVIDCNRHLTDPNSIPAASDGVSIPANANISEAERKARQDRWYWPYHVAVGQIVRERLSASPVIVSVHSMTDQMRGQFRPWEIALSSDQGRRLTNPVLAALNLVPGLTVGDNEPYNLDPAEDFSTPTHALQFGLHHVQVEFRQDLVGTREGAERYAAIFADALVQGLNAIGREASGHA
ncbi:MAG: N-formylglutamate amidohydrolase [Hyphomicrobiales bacterium]